MSGIHFGNVFGTAFEKEERGKAKPYSYQCRLACGPEADPERPDTLKSGAPCQSQLIEIPTGLGKTAAVVLAWLWNRVLQPNVEARSEWPRRLIFCLPMRTLVEQTRDNVAQWLKNLWEKRDKLELDETAKEQLEWLKEHSPIVLMGGESAGEWDIYPDKDAILIGTQDMLLSRALNRGYGMSRYRWPMHFGLLNSDCLWVLDETQLMGVSVETSAQLDGFRHRAEWQSAAACPTWWMSATLAASQLATVDHPEPAAGWKRIALSVPESSSGRPKELISAKKKISPAPFALNASTKAAYARQVADFVVQRHRSLLESPHPAGTLTLVVVNNVRRAQEIHAALTAGKKPLYDSAKVALVHSRFRRKDRKKHEALLFGTGDRIVIATQAVEAGVDVSARLLITELAPWSSLVQRVGRCNRRAEFSDAEVLWLKIEPDAKGELLLPYTQDELDQARDAITSLTDADAQTLRDLKIEEGKVIRPVLRRRDLIDLFDTTPDLCGQDLDISRYIRDNEDSDVQFFWRDLGEGGAATEGVPLSDDELCRVSIRDARRFLKSDRVRAHLWDPLHKEWVETRRVRPGGVFLIEAASGGYAEADGWTGDIKDKLGQCPAGVPQREAYDNDRYSFIRHWQELERHTAEVVEEMAKLATRLMLSPSDSALLRTAAQWHDVGKAHDFFQKLLREGPEEPPAALALYAKSKNPPKRGPLPEIRRGFRHELASALAWLFAAPAEIAGRDLIAYIIAAHHGKVRLSIRALPDEKGPTDDTDRPYARGIWHGDALPSVSLGEITTPPLTLDLSFMQMGEGKLGPSWLARMIALRDRLGPFRIAYLETLLRAADMRASAAAEKAATAS